MRVETPSVKAQVVDVDPSAAGEAKVDDVIAQGSETRIDDIVADETGI